MKIGAYGGYASAVIDRLWNFAEREFSDRPEFFEGFNASPTRPPVFVPEAAEHNLLYPPGAASELRQTILFSLPASERHRHFTSMRSSQALAQSVFGAFIALDKMDLLGSLTTDDGLPAFFDGVAQSNARMEAAVGHLGEPRPTSVDVWFDGERRVAVECKFTEPEFGRCSRPALRPVRDANYERDHCDGSYTRQRGRRSRCSLTEVGVRYWEYVPVLFDWQSDCDLSPCPLHGTYQLARNVLAACVRLDGSIDATGGHALIVYDDRNPSFQSDGEAQRQWEWATDALLQRQLLRRCSWQRLVAHIADDTDLAWLVDGLNAKYGIRPPSS